MFQDEIHRKVTRRPRSRLPRDEWLRWSFSAGSLRWDQSETKRPKIKVRDPSLAFSDCGWICRHRNLQIGLGIRLSGIGLGSQKLKFGILKSESWTSKIGIWDLGTVKIEKNQKSENRKIESGVKNYENRNFGKVKIRNRNLDRKSGNSFLSKTNENLRNRQKVTHEKNYFQKDDQTGYRIKEYYFQNEPNPS